MNETANPWHVAPNIRDDMLAQALQSWELRGYEVRAILPAGITASGIVVTLVVRKRGAEAKSPPSPQYEFPQHLHVPREQWPTADAVLRELIAILPDPYRLDNGLPLVEAGVSPPRLGLALAYARRALGDTNE